MIIRHAKPKDASEFVKIKDQLPMSRPSHGKDNSDGFLLGTTKERYVEYIDSSYSLVVESSRKIIGFGIILPNHVLIHSDIWAKRDKINWRSDTQLDEKLRLCYFEQLAFLPGKRALTVGLSYLLVKHALLMGHDGLLTTLVEEPIRNRASLQFIIAVGGEFIGYIDENYPKVGRIKSGLYYVSRDSFFKNVRTHSLYSYLQKYTVA